jgi:glucokinase
MRILAGDIGGTHARLIYVDDDPQRPIRRIERYACARYSGLIPVIEEFLAQQGLAKVFDAVCLAVAGPVFDGRASITNLPWEISTDALAALLNARSVFLINDLAAVAHAVPGLPAEALVVLQQGPAGSPLNAAVVGVGTGLGAAHLVWCDDRYLAFSSEAGHAGFAPATAEQERLLAWLHQQHDHVSVEMLLSGRGIFTLYRFYRDVLGEHESDRLREQMAGLEDPAPLISHHALAADDPLCCRALACFVEILGAVVGDVALHYFPLNAIYLAGGVVTVLQPLLGDPRFLQALCNKGPMQHYLEQLTVALINSGTAGLDGAVAYARQQGGLAGEE